MNINAAIYSQDKGFSFDLKGKTIRDAISMIERKSDFQFLYNEKFKALNKKVELNLKNNHLENLQDKLLVNSNMTYRVLESNLIVLTPKSVLQRNVVKGRVTDKATGEPLPGVSIVVKGTTRGTLTDTDGKYSIEVQGSDEAMVFTYVGYLSQIVYINDRKQIDVSLESATTKLEEIVVIGYGTQRKEAVTGSVSSIRGDAMRDVPAANISQALQGRIAGVEMSQSSTKPGSAMQIRIRGARSLNATNDPLVVLDGIPFAGNIGDINPSDIKSIDILKDASATAIYGSRGANGVLIVTTNKGKLGQKAIFSYNGYVGIKSIFAKYPMMNGPEFAALRKIAGKYSNGTDESDSTNTDWQDLFYKTGMVTSHDLGVAGGTEKGNYNFGIGYYRDEAIIPMQNYSRYSLRGSLDQGVGKSFRFGFNTNNFYSINNGNNLGLYGLLSSSPLANPYNADGTWKRVIKMPLDNTWVYSKDIIENLGDKWVDMTKAFGSYNSLYGEVKIPGIEGLKYRANIGLNFRMSNSGSYTGEGVFNSEATTPSTATIGNSLTTNWVIENLLTYDRTFAEKHEISAVALYSAEQTMYNSSQVSAKSIPTDAFQFYNLGQASGEFTINPSNQNYYKNGLMSWMGRVMYSYDNRYMISATFRSDASSVLAKGHKWHSYPAISAGWNIKNESFLKDIKPIDLLKLRAGFGQTSNQAVTAYSTLGVLSTRPYNFGDNTYSTGYYVSQLPNPNLGWEYSKTWNFGLDFGLLGNRLSGSLEYYITKTNDILLYVNLPPTSGVNNFMGNVGKTENKGFEFSVNGVILNNLSGWTWEAGINVYANRNKLTELATGQTRDESNWWFVGHPIDVIFDYQKIGLWQQNDQFLKTYEPSGDAGMIKVKYTGTYNNDGSPTRAIGPADRQIINLEPNFQGGFNTRLSYKGIDFSAVGVFKSGGKLISTLYSSSGYLNLMTGRRNNVKVDYWTTTNTGAKYPKPGGPQTGDNPTYGSTLGYFNASYLKIRILSLGYTFKQNWVKTIGIENLRLYFTVENPFVMFSPYHKESNQDPETNSYANDAQNMAVPYSDNQKRLLTIGTNTPTTRNYLIGVNLSF
ncbi:MAG: TonB-dependent receptor [Bacteroidota bacterium]|nr:TonB-dependent receptor [Bacteroidota bacterium]